MSAKVTASSFERLLSFVEAETDYAGFRWAEEENRGTLEKAARRVVRYWKIRKDMFGLDRAFLPMTLDGAMAEDIALLSLGYAYLLPDDNHGRAVFFWDRTGFTSRSASREAMLRCLFYNVHMLTFAVSDRKKGFVVVVNCRSFDLYKHFDRILSTNLRRLVEVAPLLLRGLHIGAGPGSSVLDLVMPVLKIIHGKRVRLRLQLHKGSDQEIVQSLTDYGLDKRHGMAVFSGTVYNQERCGELLEEQRGKERALAEAVQGNHR
jgi:hypothetical protein